MSFGLRSDTLHHADCSIGPEQTGSRFYPCPSHLLRRRVVLPYLPPLCTPPTLFSSVCLYPTSFARGVPLTGQFPPWSPERATESRGSDGVCASGDVSSGGSHDSWVCLLPDVCPRLRHASSSGVASGSSDGWTTSLSFVPHVRCVS